MTVLHRRPPSHAWLAGVASACARLGTWGIEPETRADLIAEREADLADQLADPEHNSPGRIAGRAIRTLLADIWRRMLSSNVSALPLGAASLSVGIGAMVYLILQPLPGYRLSLLLNGLGFLLLGITAVRSPRTIRRTPTATAAILIASGSAVGLALIPKEDAVSLFYYAAMGSFALAVAGFSSLSLMLVYRRPSLQSPISAIRTAALLLAFGEIGWALYMIGENLYEVLAAVMVATGAMLLMRFFGRLRELPIEM